MSQLEPRLREIVKRWKGKKNHHAGGTLLGYRETLDVLELYDAALENCGPKMEFGSDRLHRALKRLAGKPDAG